LISVWNRSPQQICRPLPGTLRLIPSLLENLPVCHLWPQSIKNKTKSAEQETNKAFCKGARQSSSRWLGFRQDLLKKNVQSGAGFCCFRRTKNLGAFFFGSPFLVFFFPPPPFSPFPPFPLFFFFSFSLCVPGHAGPDATGGVPPPAATFEKKCNPPAFLKGKAVERRTARADPRGEPFPGVPWSFFVPGAGAARPPHFFCCFQSPPPQGDKAPNQQPTTPLGLRAPGPRGNALQNVCGFHLFFFIHCFPKFYQPPQIVFFSPHFFFLFVQVSNPACPTNAPELFMAAEIGSPPGIFTKNRTESGLCPTPPLGPRPRPTPGRPTPEWFPRPTTRPARGSPQNQNGADAKKSPPRRQPPGNRGPRVQIGGEAKFYYIGDVPKTAGANPNRRPFVFFFPALQSVLKIRNRFPAKNGPCPQNRA